MYKSKQIHKGVPIGYKHRWDYKNSKWIEQKTAPGKWKFAFSSSKHRSKGSRTDSMGPMKPGHKVSWKINAVQQVRKTSKNSYQTMMVGQKRLLQSRRG